MKNECDLLFSFILVVIVSATAAKQLSQCSYGVEKTEFKNFPDGGKYVCQSIIFIFMPFIYVE